MHLRQQAILIYLRSGLFNQRGLLLHRLFSTGIFPLRCRLIFLSVSCSSLVLTCTPGDGELRKRV
jgi:hypothetical protein